MAHAYGPVAYPVAPGVQPPDERRMSKGQVSLSGWLSSGGRCLHTTICWMDTVDVDNCGWTPSEMYKGKLNQGEMRVTVIKIGIWMVRVTLAGPFRPCLGTTNGRLGEGVLAPLSQSQLNICICCITLLHFCHVHPFISPRFHPATLIVGAAGNSRPRLLVLQNNLPSTTSIPIVEVPIPVQFICKYLYQYLAASRTGHCYRVRPQSSG